MNIFESLREDHEVQRKLADLLVSTHGASDDRKRLYGCLKKAMQTHAKAEERHFYKPLLEHDLTQKKARHSIAEHQELDERLKELEETDPSSAAWLVIAKKLVECLEHHLDEEEREVFQLAGKVLSEAQKKSLAGKYRTLMQEDLD